MKTINKPCFAYEIEWRHLCGQIAMCLLVLGVVVNSGCLRKTSSPTRVEVKPLLKSETVSDADAVPFRQITIDADAPLSPWTKIAGDFDGDGLTDLVVAGRQHMLVWYRSPTWRKSIIHTGGFDTVNGNAADIDNDGDLDIVMGGVVWFENPAPREDPGKVRWRRHLIGKEKTHDVEMGDLDGDGRLDVVSRNQSRFGHGDGDRFHLWFQQGPEQWLQRTIHCPHGEGIELGDIDSDGDLDVILAARWYENTGDPKSDPWPEHVYTHEWNHGDVQIALADINGDGRSDLVLTPAELADEHYRIAWYEQPKTGVLDEWTEHIIEPEVEAVYHSLRLVDIDEDGDIDVVTAEMQQSHDPDDVVVYLNNDQGRHWKRQILSHSGSHGLLAADFDGDNDIDIIGANHSSHSVELWQNQIREPNRKVLSLDRWRRHLIDPKLPDKAIFITAADLNGDNRKDIIAGNWWYSHPQKPGETWQRHPIVAGTFQMAAVYDFDQDGNLDILGTRGQGAEANSSFVLAQGHGDGTFSLSKTLLETEGDFLQGVAVGRYYPMGPIQIALSWHNIGGRVQMLTVPSRFRFGKEKWTWHDISDNSEDEDLSMGDIDADGDIDLLLGVKWLENPGLQKRGQAPQKWHEHTLGSTTQGLADRNALVDLNGDGLLDSVVGLEKGSDLLWYQGPKDPKQSWPRRIIARNVGGGFSMDTADIDHDGDIDIVLGEHRQRPNNRVIIYENQNQADAWVAHVIDSGPDHEIDHHDGTQLIDIDNDGDLDIVSVGWYNAKVWFYENLAIE